MERQNLCARTGPPFSDTSIRYVVCSGRSNPVETTSGGLPGVHLVPDYIRRKRGEAIFTLQSTWQAVQSAWNIFSYGLDAVGACGNPKGSASPVSTC
jgi:hypothetical protein